MTTETKKTPAEYAAIDGVYDCTGFIGPQLGGVGEVAWPMYSYDRPAYYLWNAIACELYRRGWSDPEIKGWLQSKATRWALDGKLGDMVRVLGEEYAANYITDDEKKYAASR